MPAWIQASCEEHMGFRAQSVNKTSGKQVRSGWRSDCWPQGHQAECFTSQPCVCSALTLKMRHTWLRRAVTGPCVQSTCESAVCGNVCMHLREFDLCTQTQTRCHVECRSAGWLAGWLGRPRCQVAVGVPACDPGISVFVLCHSPSLWGDDSPAVPEGM